jgi:hypothetical protein
VKCTIWRRRRRPRQPDLVQVAVEELRAAGDVVQRELGAVAPAAVARAVADVAGVVEQRGDDAEDGARRAEPVGGGCTEVSCPWISRAIASTMSSVCWMVVVAGVAAEVAGLAAAEQASKSSKASQHRSERHAPGVGRVNSCRARVSHTGSQRADEHGVGHVVLAAPVLSMSTRPLVSGAFMAESVRRKRGPPCEGAGS